MARASQELWDQTVALYEAADAEAHAAYPAADDRSLPEGSPPGPLAGRRQTPGAHRRRQRLSRTGRGEPPTRAGAARSRDRPAPSGPLHRVGVAAASG